MGLYRFIILQGVCVIVEVERQVVFVCAHIL